MVEIRGALAQNSPRYRRKPAQRSKRTATPARLPCNSDCGASRKCSHELALAVQTLPVHLVCGASLFAPRASCPGSGSKVSRSGRAICIQQVQTMRSPSSQMLANHHLSREYHYPYKTTLDYPFETRARAAHQGDASLDYPFETQILRAITPSKLKNFHALTDKDLAAWGYVRCCARERRLRRVASWDAKIHHRLAHVDGTAVRVSE